MRSFPCSKLLALAAPAALFLSSPAAGAEGVARARRPDAAATRPMVDHDGCPLPGNVGKGASRPCAVRERPVTASRDAAPAPAARRAPGSRR